MAISILAALLCATVFWLAQAQNSQLGVGKNFLFPDYYPSTNGVSRTRSLIRGEEYRFLSNNTVIALTAPRFEAFREDGATLEWTAIARDAVVDVTTREVNGSTNMFFRTADDSFFLTGVGFLWQQSSGVLILSNKTFTWIDTRKLTNSSSKRSGNKMKAIVAASLVATARLSAAEMEVPPARPGLTINAEMNIMMLKTNIVIFSNNVVVIDPPAKPGDEEMRLTCHWLIGRRDASGRIQDIEAHGRVAIDQGDVHARGNYAIYTATNDLMALVGAFDPADTNHPKPYIFTSASAKSSTVITNAGNAIIYDRIRNTLTTMGGAIATIPGTSLKSSSPTNTAPAATNRAPKTP